MFVKSHRGGRRVRPAMEMLEDRSVPATFGVPWLDPSDLTLSFVPDGTTIAGHSSSLFGLLNSQQATVTWEREILQAFQTWAVNANINIGLTADGGEPLGSAGDPQHDSRFGDIRVGAQAMDADVLSISVPNDPAVLSTLTGDVLINTSDNFGKNGMDLFSVMLHEAGHVFGIPDGTDPKSPMYPTYLDNTKLTSADINNLQALYGTRAPDPNEGSGGNDSVNKATTIQPPSGFNGATPLVTYGDISTNNDVDFFSFRPPSGYTGSVTIRLQSTGISLLTPHLSLVDAKGNVLSDTSAASDFGDAVTLSLSKADPKATYYLKVQGESSDVFGIGSYGLAVTFDGRSTVSANSLDAVLRGPNHSLSPDEISALLAGNSNILFHKDNHDNDDSIAATVLPASHGFATNSHYETVGSISGSSDIDYYKVKSPGKPKGGDTLYLTATVRASDVNGTTPRVTILDSDGNAVPSQILANGDGTFAVQATIKKGGGNFLIEVSPSTSPGAPATGNYSLVAQYGAAAAALPTLAANTVPAAPAEQAFNLYVGESQLMNLVLAADTVNGAPAPGAAVQLIVRNAAGKVVYSLTAAAGDVASGAALFLTPGAYTVHITAVNAAGLALKYNLEGEGISDPIGPVLRDPTLNPVYTPPPGTPPGWFFYPNGTLTTATFMLVPIR
jgi:hypothetical protein